MSCHCHKHDEHHEHSCSCCGGHEHNHEHGEENSKLLIIRLIIGGAVFAAGLITGLKPLYVIAYVILGYDVIFNALRDIKHIFNESFLMSIATIGAFAIGDFAEAVAVMLFYQIGEMVSDFAVGKSKDSITGLMDLRADTANVNIDGKWVITPCENVKIGDRILVSAGEKIPLDGRIVKGSAALDTSALTGEAMPVSVSVGCNVMSGSVNTNSVIEIEVTKIFSESTASKILELVQTGKNSKSEKFITKFASIYTPIVVLIAALLVLIPTSLTGDIKNRIYTAMMFLVVSCPCALVVSVPLTFVAGIGGASRNGILVKGSYALENLAKTQLAAFDKTGTLTEGVFKVRKISALHSENDLLKYAAYAEHYSSHPIAKAISAEFGAEIDTSLISDYTEIAGNGVCANVDGHTILVGSYKYAGGGNPEKNAVYVTVDGSYEGYLVIEDRLKSNAKPAVEQLKSMGIETLMLTGDAEYNAKPIADELNIPYYAGLLPQNKVEHIKNSTKNTLFTGDGINDAPVLSCADTGVSMGGIGSDAAIEASDAVIMADDLSKLPLGIKIARHTMTIVRENIWFAIAVKIIIMLLGILNLATMWAAVFADVGVCLIAVLNAVRAIRIRD